MSKAGVCLLSFVLLFFAAFSLPAEIQLTDVLHLSDGTVLEGVITEEEPGRTLTLLTADRQCSTLPIARIVRVEKKLELLESPVRYRDVVFLTDGVIFRGTVVERVPKQSITLELENGRLLDFQLPEVWKIVAERITSAEVRPAALDREKAEKLKVELQIQIVQQRLEGSGRKESTDPGAREEAEQLKDDLEQLEKERRQTEERLAQEEQRQEEVRGEWAPLDSELQEALEGIATGVGACEQPEIQMRLQQLYAQLRQDVDRLVLHAQTASLAAQPNPRVEQAAHEKMRTEALVLAANGSWRKRQYREQFREAVSGLSRAERQAIYRETKKDPPIGSSALNLIPLLSLGSWSQGDILGASLTMGAMVGGTLIITFIDEGWPYYLGSALGIGGWAISVFQPFIQNVLYNQALRTALVIETASSKPHRKGGRS